MYPSVECRTSFRKDVGEVVHSPIPVSLGRMHACRACIPIHLAIQWGRHPSHRPASGNSVLYPEESRKIKHLHVDY